MKGGKSKGDTSKKADAKLSVKRKAAEKPAKKRRRRRRRRPERIRISQRGHPVPFLFSWRSLGSNLRRKIPTISKSPLSAKLLEISGNLCRLRIKLRSKQRRPSGRPSTIRSWSLTIRNSLTAGGKKSAEDEDDEEESDKSKSEVHDDEEDDESGDEDEEDDDDE